MLSVPLAAGADILIAETLMSAKAELHFVLPAMPEIFKSQSVEPFGGTWGQRFDRLCAAAASVEVIGDGATVSTGSIALASLVAKGMAIDKAQRMESHSLSMQVIDEHSPVPSADIIVRFPRTAASPAMRAIEESTMRMLVAGKSA